MSNLTRSVEGGNENLRLYTYLMQGLGSNASRSRVITVTIYLQAVVAVGPKRESKKYKILIK